MTNWVDSKTIKYLFFTWLGSLLLQLAPMVLAHKIDVWDLAAQAISIFAGIMLRMAQNDVVAPKALNFLNKSNIG